MDFYMLPYGDNIYKIFKEETESKEQFNSRCWFIAKKQPTTSNFNNIVSLSKIYRNVKYLDTEYPENIMKQLI